MTNPTPHLGSKVGRARQTLGQLWQVPTFLLGLLALVGVAGSTPWRLTPQEREFEQLVKTLRQGLDNDEAGDALVGQAENLKLRLSYFPARSAEANFLIGSAYYRQAKHKRTGHAKAIWPHAAEHLEKALAAGVSAGDRAALQYRLGFALYQQNTEAPRALELMAQGAEKGAEQPLQAYQLLVQANLQRTPSDVDAARAAMRRVLDLTPERDVEAMASARLQHAVLLMRKELRADAIKELERIGPKVSRELRVKARLLQARCCEEDGLWHKAIPIWQALLADAGQVEGGKARILYALGWCHHQHEPPSYSDAVRAWSEALQLGGAAGQAAGLRLGNLRLAREVNEPAQALIDWKAALEKVNEPTDYKNPYLAIEEVRAWFESAIDQFQDAQDPEKTQTVAELYRKLVPGGAAQERVALAAEARANQLAAKLRAKEPNVTLAEVCEQYRKAGEAYEIAASARPEAERTESLWRSAQCYLLAKDNARAQQILKDYVKTEVKELRLAEAWLIRGDLYRLEGNKSYAHDSYRKCIEYPKTPFAYRARYWRAVEEEIDHTDYEKACKILQDNLNDQSPDLERAWQEKSAFKMASLLMKIGHSAEDAARKLAEKLTENRDKVTPADVEAQVRRAGAAYNEAHIHLKDFLHNFPESANALVTRDQLGECYRKLAEQEKAREFDYQRMITAGLSEERRRTLEDSVRQHRKARIDLLTLAVNTYQALVTDLEKARLRGEPFGKLEQVLLRRALFGVGECYLDNEEFPEAQRIFQKLQEKHRRTLESIIACYHVCNLTKKIRQPEAFAAAKVSVRMLLEDLAALAPEDDLFRLPGVSSHAEWLQWAKNTERLLNAPAPPPTDSGLPAIR